MEVNTNNSDLNFSVQSTSYSYSEHYLVGKCLSVEVNGVHVYFVTHAQQIPVNLLTLCHHQSVEVTVQLPIYTFDLQCHK